ncbi:hypothetical protein EKO04_001723 [Ascochyta lentis]|uniref:CCHC-type domain-containing protein n=1 Tax=Ascochyta lentis TaxID=205686 RepID=A0A8H7J8K1_9PLEO|nr:hypothetical protein EKO04_001723 [Ascochyta lentis]
MGLPNHSATPSTSVQTVDDRPSKTMKLPDMKDKLRSMGDQEAVLGVAYMFNRLEGQAAQVGLSWKDCNPMGTTAQFWDFLDELYKDSLFEERSWQKLQTITMKKSNQSVESFNAEFIQLAYDAAEEDNTKNLKTRYMSALRPDLQDKMVVLAVEVNLRRSKALTNGTFGQHTRRTNPDSMDWEPTRVHSGKIESDNRPRAEWQTQEVINQRRAANVCLRCGKKGHYVSRCNLAPAKRPEKVQVRSAIAEVSETDDSTNEGSEN